MATALHAALTRSSINEILAETELIPQQFLPVFEALPNIGLILNRNRQILFGNKTLIDNLGLRNLNEALGQRPGEIMRCIHAHKEEMGCSAAAECHYCGAVEVVIRAQRSGEQQSGECRISSKFGDKVVCFDLRVTCTPFFHWGNEFYLVIIEDISAEKRKARLERTFFHDITNTTSGILYTASLLNHCRPAKQPTFVQNLIGQCHALADEVQAQRELLAAEAYALQTSFSGINPRELIDTELATFRLRYKRCHFELDPSSCHQTVNSDPRLVRRILINLLKNAAEADNEAEVSAGCREQDDQLVIWVRNSEVMPERVRSQVFQRSFSTKGEGRGIGTYSIKLLAENYLGAKVDFVSNTILGTIFRLYLPLARH